jgi:hypothetical protein
VLGRKTFTREELDHAKASVGAQRASYETLVEAIAGATPDDDVEHALEAFEGLFFNNMVLVLDRPFVHRVRMVTGKDCNSLNEVEMLCDSLIPRTGSNVFQRPSSPSWSTGSCRPR